MRQIISAVSFGINEPDEKILEYMKNAGFDGIFKVWSVPGCFDNVYKKAKELGLSFDYAHGPYTGAAHLWEDSPKARAEINYLLAFIEDCGALGIGNIFLHTIIGMKKNTPCELGAERFGILFKRAEELGITVHLENTEGECYLEYLFKAFPDKIKFCIDTGHEMCYNESRDLITKYANRLGSTHINDNIGQTGDEPTWFDDSHLLPFDGIRDWEETARRLRAAKYEGPVILEITKVNKPGRHTNDIYLNMTAEEYIKTAYERACRLRSML